jgi:hypothetical protein
MWPFEATPDGGFVMSLKSQTPVADDIMQRDMPVFLEGQREQRQMAAFSIWMSREMQPPHVIRPAPKPAPGEEEPPPPG